MAVKQHYKDQLLEVVRRYFPQSTVYLFGSRATDTERIGSDIDIAIDTGEEIPFKILLRIGGDIEETSIPMKVDVVDFQSANQQLKSDILREGIIWQNFK